MAAGGETGRSRRRKAISVQTTLRNVLQIGRRNSRGAGRPRTRPSTAPGDAWVDNVAVDAFNIYCRTKSGSFANPWRSLATRLDPFIQFVAGHPGPDLVVAEWGSSEDPNNPGRKAQWIADAQTMFKQPA
jgi:hypothetical protein